MVNPYGQHSPQSVARSSARESDGDRQESPQDGAWSGVESGGEGTEPDGLRKRKRPMSVSCELCKQRKVKCDRGQPSCGWCLRNAQVCEYKERKKPGLRAGYGRELEKRLGSLRMIHQTWEVSQSITDRPADRLEGIIQSQGQLLETHLLNRPLQNNEQSQEMSTYRSASDGRPAHVPRPEAALFLQKPSVYSTPSQSTGQALIDYNNSLTAQTPSIVQDNSYPHPQQQLQNGMQSAGMAGVATGPSDYYTNGGSALESPTLNISSEPQASLTNADMNFPPYDLLYALVDLYFKHINSWCPILHRKTTLDALFGPSTLDEADRILLHAIVATTLRFSTDSRLNAENRKHFHATSKQKVLLYGLENSSVKALQALVILALDLTGSSNGPPGWNILALITRSVVQLGLAVETTSSLVAPIYPSIYTLRAMVLPEPKSWIEDEGRRRLFWMVYLLDRYATIATAFEFALDEKEIDRKLPCRDDLFARNQPVETTWFHTAERTDYSMNKPENLGSFSYYCEVLGILSRTHQFLKRPVDIGALSDVEEWQRSYRDLDSELQSWKYNLPSEYGNIDRLFSSTAGNKIVNCGWVMLHATYHTAVIRLHSSAGYPTTRSPIFTPSFSASQKCLGAVREITSLGEYVVNNGMLNKLGPPFAFTLWVAARLLLVHSSTIEHKVHPQIMFFVTTLAEMGKYWNVAQRYSDILRRVLEEYQQSEQSLGANGERITPSTVKILADMRRCAYDLDFLISRQPRPIAQTYAAATPARTPAPNELEYLDVFDFFNMPRLPAPQDAGVNGANGGVGAIPVPEMPGSHNEFNITNYMIPNPESDWLFKSNT